MVARSKNHRRVSRRRLEELPREELLGLRLCDLPLKIEGSWIEPLIGKVRAELSARGLRFRPHFWLSDEWFCPDGVPGVGIPFYLAHPRLMRLERSEMLEVEGGNREDCLKLLRHELGHAVDHAYGLCRRRIWRNTFGRSSDPYPEWYRPNPRSRRFVQHLDAWYAQAHPDEDFAETFAVWLRPRSNWRKRYERWPAVKKLEVVDEMMRELVDKPPRVRSRATPDSLPRLRRTLRTHYERKRARYGVDFSEVYDRDLARLFSDSAEHRHHPSAAGFLRKHRPEIRELVAKWTGEYVFTVDQVLKEMIGRCRQLRLRAVGSERRLKLDFAILLTVHSATYQYRGRDWHPV